MPVSLAITTTIIDDVADVRTLRSILKGVDLQFDQACSATNPESPTLVELWRVRRAIERRLDGLRRRRNVASKRSRAVTSGAL